ncbi:MAG: tRNA (N(6)-L-threonylcarbamoyladenosine(37)-C(2))-methylthiotransferase MtaB [Bacteroidales bacterium]|nr:tRNA (N(6)-L-threonylcarbamoyladenosine(37)-C(2))-methylthiotransferase MtaB [Candidatus Cryptobacteroides caccocaballi]
MTKNIAYVTLGCKLNYAETSTYERALTEAGCTTTSWTSGKADVCLVNTCTVTEHSDKKCRNIIRKLHRVSPGADIVVTGCYAQLKRDEILELEGVKAVFGANEKTQVVPYILGECNGDKAPCMFAAYSSGERTRSFLKVQDGCNNFCTYCTVPYARGESRNIPIADIIPQAREIASKGIREIVLTGVNTGDFGRSTGENFFGLIKELDKVEGIERYRISSIEPNLLTEEMIDWIAAGSKFLPHFHIPLQSGCDAVLSEMHRHYDTEFFARKIEYIRKAMEGPGKLPVFFGIDVIVGFPGETDEMFEETYRFLAERVKPAFIHIFPYSRRAGTPAAARKDQVRDGIKTERVEKLEALCDRLHSEFIDSCKGLKAKVLFESSDKKGMMYGYTENYIQVARPYDKNLVGRISEVEI